MLPRTHRLVTDKDFARLFSKGKSWAGRGFRLKAIKNDTGVTRVGFVVSTKIAKKAVVRNLIKRRARDIMRKHMPSLYKGADIAIIATAPSKDMSFLETSYDIVELLQRSGLLPRT